MTLCLHSNKKSIQLVCSDVNYLLLTDTWDNGTVKQEREVSSEDIKDTMLNGGSLVSEFGCEKTDGSKKSVRMSFRFILQYDAIILFLLYYPRLCIRPSRS